MAPASKAQQKATNKYIAKAYDRVNLTMPKGKKEVVSNRAQKQGKSLNSYINEAVDEKMERDDQK